MHLKKEVETLEEHPVEAGEVEEVGEGEGGAEEGLGQVQGREGVPGQSEDPVEGRQTKCSKQAHVDLVPQTAHFPEHSLSLLHDRLSKKLTEGRGRHQRQLPGPGKKDCNLAIILL